MPPRPFDAIICDIDGCLAPESSTPFDTERLARLAAHNRRAARSGGVPPVTLCSGRPQPFVEAIARAIACPLPCVAENGVWLYHPADNRYDMDPRITDEHLAAVDAARVWVRRDLGPRGVSIQPGKTASISLYHPDAAFLRTLESPVRERFGREGWPLRVSMTWLYVNCDLDHVGKGTGLDRLVEAAGLPPGRLAGIGDTPGDAAVRERVAWFACPANAHEDLKPRADYVSPHPEVEGVLDILNHLSAP